MPGKARRAVRRGRHGHAAVRALGLMLGLAVLGGCDSDAVPGADAGAGAPAAGAAPARAWTIPAAPGTIARGARLYAEHCARCHGERGEGAPRWTQRGPDGRWPPPPLDGSGHTWHHDLATLKRVIREGSPAGQGNMPAWGDKLTEEEIEAVIAWFQSRWPAPIRETWLEMNARATRG